MMRNKYARLWIVSGTIILLDQVTKWMVLKGIPLFHSIPVIPGFFNLVHIHNPGGAFGFLSSNTSGVKRFVFLFASSLAIGLILYLYRQAPKRQTWLSYGLALVFGGAVGNLIDRIWMGKVVDFLDFYIGSLHWPAFNVADSAVSAGMVIFVFHLLFNRFPE
jgi:signal peptidase II